MKDIFNATEYFKLLDKIQMDAMIQSTRELVNRLKENTRFMQDKSFREFVSEDLL